MKLDRRTALKSMGVLAAGATILPSCNLWENRVPLSLNNIKITLDQEDTLTRVISVIIPKDEQFPGAVELQVPNFVWTMVDDCMEKPDQERFLNGLDQYARYEEKFAEPTFVDMLPEQQVGFLITVMEQQPTSPKAPAAEGQELPPEQYLADIQFFLMTAKSHSIGGYMQSQYIMTEVMPYSLVPGTFSLCETIDPNKRINING